MAESEQPYRINQESEYLEELIGPDGFFCRLGEPEDLTWWRDLKPVVEELNERHAEVERLRSRVAELDELSDNRRHKIKQMAAVLGGLRQENSGLRAALVEERAKILYYLDMIGDETFYHWEDVEVADHVRGEYLEKARAALGGEPSDLVMVRRSFLVPFARIAERLDACESSCKLLDSAHLAKPLDDIPEGVAYISLGMVQELARLVRGDR